MGRDYAIVMPVIAGDNEMVVVQIESDQLGNFASTAR
jgi:hypothetical protein